jgi:dynein heavy chain
MHSKPDPKTGDAWSLDDVIYYTQVKEREFSQIRSIEPEGCYIEGLFLEGCRWNRNSLDDAEPKKMFAPLPILYVTA